MHQDFKRGKYKHFFFHFQAGKQQQQKTLRHSDLGGGEAGEGANPSMWGGGGGGGGGVAGLPSAPMQGITAEFWVI